MHMRWNFLTRVAGRCGVVAGTLLAGASGLAQELREVVVEAAAGGEQSPNDQAQVATEATQVEVVAVEGEPGENAVQVFTAGAPASEYWVGLMCEPAGEALRSQLKLGERQALVVVEVVPDSPAAKGGLEKYDVLLEVGGKNVADSLQLVQVVEETKENDLTFKILRGGAGQVITLKPAKRPESAQQGFELKVDPANPGGIVRRFMKRGAMPGDAGGRVFRFSQPGAVMTFSHASELPDGVSISINKNGKEPAKITIKKGDKTWETTEDKVSELPEDIRELVGKMHIHAGDGHFLFGGLGGAEGFTPFGGDEQAVIVEGGKPGKQRAIVRRGVPFPAMPGAEAHANLEKQIAELSEQIAALRKAIEEMKNK